MAIEILSKENLIKHGFDEETINRFFKNENFEIRYNSFFASEIENKIYSGIDFYRLVCFEKDKKPYFPKYCIELLPEYVNRSFDYLIKKEKEKTNNIFFEQKIKERFINKQIQFCYDEIEKLNKTNLRHTAELILNNLQNALDWFEDYKTNKLNKTVDNSEEKIKLKEHEIANELTGRTNQNKIIGGNPKFQLEYDYIDNVLIKYDLTPNEAIKILLRRKGDFSSDFYDKVTTKIIEHLESLNKYFKIENSKTNSILKIAEPDNPYNSIFVDSLSYKLFMEWHKAHETNTKNHLTNYSFIIQKMKNDKLIYDIKQAAYLEFLIKCNISLHRLKTYQECKTSAKETLYSTLLHSIYKDKK